MLIGKEEALHTPEDLERLLFQMQTAGPLSVSNAPFLSGGGGRESVLRDSVAVSLVDRNCCPKSSRLVEWFV